MFSNATDANFSSVSINGSRAQPFGGVEGGGDDALVAGAAAEVAGDRDPHLLLGRIGIVAQELGQRGQHARRAEAALQAVIVAERLLQRIELVGARREPSTVVISWPSACTASIRQERAGQAVEQDRAGAADAVLAAEMRAGEAERVAQEIGERQPHLDLGLVALAVHRQRDLACLAHVVARSMRRAAAPAGQPRARLLQRAPRHHGREMLAVGGRRVHVVDRLELAAGSRRLRAELVVRHAGRSSACSTSRGAHRRDARCRRA